MDELSAVEPQPNRRKTYVIYGNCRGNPQWLPILRAATGGRPYIILLNKI
jgi:hypothetical protein